MQKPYNNQYHNHKVRAKKRGLEFHFTYEEWINWWGDDIINRGRKLGQLVMARNGDQGPYHPSNVRKATVEENVKEGQTGRPKTPEHIAKRVASHIATFEQRNLIKETE